MYLCLSRDEVTLCMEMAKAKRCLATVGSNPELVIELTHDEANKATPVFWPGPLVVPRSSGEA
jgi:hypothetical protein